MEKIKELYRTKTKLMLIIDLIIVIIVFILILWSLGIFDKKAEPSYILMQLKKTSKLTASEMEIDGVSKYSDKSGIKFLTKGGFTMSYHCTVQSTIDLTEASVEKSIVPKKIIVTVPKAKIGDVIFDESKTKFYDEKIAIFDFDDKDDLNRAYTQAKKEAKALAKDKGLLELAENNTGDLITELIKTIIPDGYKIEVKIK